MKVKKIRQDIHHLRLIVSFFPTHGLCGTLEAESFPSTTEIIPGKMAMIK